MYGQQTPPTAAELKAQITTAMLDMAGVLEPVYDAADGMRRDLESRGWSPTQAEQSAGAWLTATLATLASGGR
ncbi:hypothetical protein [Streptomyces silvensis]|uniref:Uncharacterized protein n=1 Tax=Streptomyces silvensis TaxID=1765722 RepID=A0A0W7X7C0_9ACTN|nr:hypothetical protein [Streptomyces silvensis]KUF18846.1 hypothetical protein AT728_07370 [Streptomyces silvensis]